MKRIIILTALLLAGRPCAFGNQPVEAGAKPDRYDVVVYGATPGGIAAAIAATREGASAILIEPSGHIGGMTAGGLSTADTGKEETIGGISREFFIRADAKYNDPKKTATPFEFWKSEPHVAMATFQEMIDEGNFDVRAIKPYQIPYRSITPHKEQCANLLVPACLSATHVAYGALRMEPQYMNFGHAAGVAAVAAIRADAAVQDIDVKALQSRLLATKQVLSLPPKAKASKAP